MKYTVKPGDTLSKIAAHYLGDASQYTAIARANHITDPQAIQVGQTLVIPVERGPAQAFPVSEAGVCVLSARQLAEMMPDAKAELIEHYLAAINVCLSRYQINTPLRVAHFIAQIGHESGSLRYAQENLNYSTKALRSVFGKYFPTDDLAEAYARKPEKIASRVYAGRMGNGDEASGEGWAYRGRGLIQLTGKDNYRAFSQAVEQELLENPELVADNPQLTVATAGWYWDSCHLNQYADQDALKQITRRINGGYNGLDDREQRLSRARLVLGC